MKLRKWQKEAAQAFFDNGCNGIVEGATASGKSLLALTVFELLDFPPSIFAAPTEKITKQWQDDLLNLGIERKHIGIVGNGMNQNNRRFIVGIINSLREQKFPNHEFCCLDEAHRYASDVNGLLLKNNNFKYKLGLTATLKREDGNHTFLIDKIGKIIYTYSQNDGISDGVVNDYKIINKSVGLTNEEVFLLAEQQNIIDISFKNFDKKYRLVQYSASNGATWEIKKEAIALRNAFTQRKLILQKAKNKMLEAVDIIKYHINDKIIVFCGVIQTTIELKKELAKNGIDCHVFHSKNKHNIEEFKKQTKGVLLTVRALDEGYNDPLLNIGIIVGGDSVQRQFIQRTGRVIRKIEGKESIIYQMYVAGTKDYDWLCNRIKGIDREIIWR